MTLLKAPLFPLTFLLLTYPVAAQAQTVEVPPDAQEVIATSVTLTDLGTQSSSSSPWRRAKPDLTLKLARPYKKICFYMRTPEGTELVALSSPNEAEAYPKGQRGQRCIDNPAMTHHVWLGLDKKPAAAGPWSIDLGFYDPAVLHDSFFAFSGPPADTLHGQYPAMKAQSGLYNMLSSDFPTYSVLRRRIFLEAPVSTFRTLKAAVKGTDLHPTTAAGFSGFPEAGETVVAMENKSGKTTVFSLDGVPVTVPNDALAPFDPAAVSLPAKSRRKPATEQGVLNIFAARSLAAAGVAPAAAWVANYEAHEKCYRKEWDKLDPGGQAHHWVLIGANGSAVDLDVAVDKKVRAACKSDASEKARNGMLGKIDAARGTFFTSTTKAAKERLAKP